MNIRTDLVQGPKRVTKTTFKTFIRKNKDKLLIKVRGKFDGQTDGIEFRKGAEFVPAQLTTEYNDHNYGIKGVWLTNTYLDDTFKHYEQDGLVGIDVANCCGYFTIAIKA